QVGEALVRAGAQDLPLSAKTGQPSVASDVLERVKVQGGEAGQLAETVLGWRHHEKAISAFLEPFDSLVRYGDGRARPTIYTLSADTGRTSCVRPNVQQLPRSGGFRACFTADPGEMIISADFSGVEIRVAAALSQDPSLMKFIHNEDAGLSDGLHWAIAREVWGPEATKAERYAAKAVVFGTIYGGGPETLAKQAGISVSLAASAQGVLRQLAPGLAAWSNDLRQAVRNGAAQYQSPWGRTILLPKDYPHKRPSYCVQGSARELLVDAYLRWRQTKWGDRRIIPVHDE